VKRTRGGRRGRPLRERKWPRWRLRHLVFAAVFVALGLLASIYITRALEIGHLNRQIQSLLDQEKTVLDRQAALHRRLAQKDDPAAIETVARAQLGLVMPGEEKVIFIKKGD